MIAPNDIKPPQTGRQRTEEQGTGLPLLRSGGVRGHYLPAGCAAPESLGLAREVGAAWPWWASALTGTYGTYRAIWRHPTVAYVMQQVLGPVAASAWDVDADDDAPAAPVEWVKDNIVRHRQTIEPHAVRAVGFGNAPFEVVWGRDAAGKYTIPLYVPLLQDNTSVMRENNGRGPFAGLENLQAKLPPAHCLYVLNTSEPLGAEPGDDYGRSRFENVRDTAWPGWLDTARRLAELEDRVSGVVPMWEVPKTAPDEHDKRMIDYATAALADLCHPRSQGVAIENPAIADVGPDAAPGRYKQLASQLQLLDMGNRAPGQAAMLDKLKYWDGQLGRGLYRGERTLFATQGGTKADAGEHGQNAEPDAESIDNMVVAHVNAGPCRTGLTLNFGPEILRKVRGVKARPLVDREKAAAQALLGQMLQADKRIVRVFDGPKVFSLAGVPHKPELWDEVTKEPEPPPAAPVPGQRPPPTPQPKQ